jgi:hypothetical protein
VIHVSFSNGLNRFIPHLKTKTNPVSDTLRFLVIVFYGRKLKNPKIFLERILHDALCAARTIPGGSYIFKQCKSLRRPNVKRHEVKLDGRRTNGCNSSRVKCCLGSHEMRLSNKAKCIDHTCHDF